MQTNQTPTSYIYTCSINNTLVVTSTVRRARFKHDYFEYRSVSCDWDKVGRNSRSEMNWIAACRVVMNKFSIVLYNLLIIALWQPCRHPAGNDLCSNVLFVIKNRFVCGSFSNCHITFVMVKTFHQNRNWRRKQRGIYRTNKPGGAVKQLDPRAVNRQRQMNWKKN